MEAGIIGKVIDSYKITGVLGKGGMGIVYRAKDMTLDRDVALKMMDAALARDKSFLKRFQSEAKALAKLQNPSIVMIFALRETELGFCIVMEFVEGNTLADRIRDKGAMSFKQALPIFRQILTALDHAHNAGIIHRDIKPSNVMLTAHDVVKVTDFGLAKIQQVTAATMTLGTGGTLYYMSPEQVRGLANVDKRGDIYSLGMTLYETLAGKVPFTDSETDFSIRQAIVEGRIPPPDRINTSLPRDLVKIIMKAIEKDPEKRYQRVAEMLEALENVSLRRKNGKPVPDQPPAGSPHKKKTWMYGVGGGLALGIIALLLYLFSGTSQATISINSQPPGSEIAIDGVIVGRTPIEGHAIEPGARYVTVQQRGFLTKDTTIQVEGGERIRLAIPLEREPVPPPLVEDRQDSPPAHRNSKLTDTERERTVNPELLGRGKESPVELGTLILQVIPTGSFSIDGKPSVRSDGKEETIRVPTGERSVRFSHPEFGSITRKVILNPGETEKVTCYFEAYVNIGVTGDSKWGTIMVDGKNTEVIAPMANFPVGVGTHKVLVTRVGYETTEGAQDLQVKPRFDSQLSHMVFTLRKK